jgi:hypothetical protein
MTKRRAFATSLLTLVMLAAMVLTPATLSAAPPSNGSLTTGIVQTIPGIGTFVGSLTTTSFQLVNGVLNAVGTLTGTFTPLVGAAQTVNQVVSLPLTGFTGTCTILTLHTGAISLNLLGLNVALAPIDLVITADAAPGNLLGNLLCAVTHLLDAGGPVSGLVALLNQILGSIRV